jgi:hypothetical protein
MHAANNPKEAIQVQGRALAFYVQLRGYDCAPVMACHERLSIFHGSAGSAAGALSHSRAHCYMLELGGGVRHPELSSAYLRMGQVRACATYAKLCVIASVLHCSLPLRLLMLCVNLESAVAELRVLPFLV